MEAGRANNNGPTPSVLSHGHGPGVGPPLWNLAPAQAMESFQGRHRGDDEF